MNDWLPGGVANCAAKSLENCPIGRHAAIVNCAES